MAIWAGGYATRWMEIAGEAKLFWFGVMFIGAATVPTLFLVFTLGLTHNGYWLTPRRLILLSIQPISTLLLQWTNQYHHIFYLSLDIAEKNASTVMEMTRGPWYFVHIVYSYAVIAIGFFVMNQGAQRLGPLYRAQYRLLFIASLLPWAANMFSEFNFAASNNLEITPLTFGLAGIIYVFSLLQTHFMDLIPIARSHLIENM